MIDDTFDLDDFVEILIAFPGHRDNTPYERRYKDRRQGYLTINNHELHQWVLDRADVRGPFLLAMPFDSDLRPQYTHCQTTIAYLDDSAQKELENDLETLEIPSSEVYGPVYISCLAIVQ